MTTNRQQRVADAHDVLVSLEKHLRARSLDEGSSVPRNTTEVLLSAAAILKAFGPMVAYELDKAEGADA